MSTPARFICGNLSACHDIPYGTSSFSPTRSGHFNTITLHNINNDLYVSQEIRYVAQKLIRMYYLPLQVLKWMRLLNSFGRHHGVYQYKFFDKGLPADVNKVQRLWNKASKAKKDVPLRANNTIDILEVMKLAVRTFDQNTIALGSARAYKSSNHLRVDAKCSAKVPRESVYDSEMYRVLVNWLVKVHNYEINGQWHLEKLCDDGDYHHFYCDLVITKRDNPNPVTVCRPSEIWVIHFSREDNVVSDPHWSSDVLQERGLNVIYFWHDKEFKNVRMSTRSRDVT
ncbi:17296_t:CDS:2, partial [Cetraspora pellucida]